MYLFFALLGAGADIGAMLGAAPVLFLYVAIIFAVHVVFILVGASICRLNYAAHVIASTACIGGPPISTPERKSGGEGKSVSVRVSIGGGRYMKQQKKNK